MTIEWGFNGTLRALKNSMFFNGLQNSLKWSYSTPQFLNYRNFGFASKKKNLALRLDDPKIGTKNFNMIISIRDV